MVYAPNSDLLQTTTCYNNSTTVLTTTRSWEYGYRLLVPASSQVLPQPVPNAEPATYRTTH